MAYRPDSTETRIKKLEKSVQSLSEKTNKNSRDLTTSKRELQMLKTTGILQMLNNKKDNGRYMYSYQEIADFYNVSVGTVSNIAREHNLSRLTAI